MKKSILLIGIIGILLLFITLSGCISSSNRIIDPNISINADKQNNGTYYRNAADNGIKYLLTVNITNKGTNIAKNVIIDEFSYCNDQMGSAAFCINNTNFLKNIGDLKPKETKIRYYNYERSGWMPIGVENYKLSYKVSSEP